MAYAQGMPLKDISKEASRLQAQLAPVATSEIIKITRRRSGWSVDAHNFTQYPQSAWYADSYFSTEGAFFGTLDGVLIAGNHESVFQYNTKKDEWIDMQKGEWGVEGKTGATGCKIGNCFLVHAEGKEFQGRIGPWLPKLFDVLINESTFWMNDNSDKASPVGIHTVNNESIQSVKKDTRSFWKQIGDNFMNFDNPPASSAVTKRKSTIRLWPNQWFRRKPEQVFEHTTPSILHNKILLIGGNHMYPGQLTRDKINVRWTKLEQGYMNYHKHGYSRKGHIAFKMKNHVYVAGGLLTSKTQILERTILTSCNKFNFKENRWSKCKHSLPYPLADASVVVSLDETFAIITGGTNKNSIPTNGIILFEEESGFKLLDDRVMRKCSSHISMPILRNSHFFQTDKM